MAIELTMPRLSDTMEQGTIIKWNIKEGDTVSAGDVVADIETDKATMEMQVFDDGVVGKILVPEGMTVEVGTVIAVVTEPDEDPTEVAAAIEARGGPTPPMVAPGPTGESAGESPVESGQPPVGVEPAVAPLGPGVIASEAEAVGGEASGFKPPAASADDRVRMSPVARRLAAEHRIDLAGLQGSGPRGRIVKRDVLRALEAMRETAAAIPPSAKALVSESQVASEGVLMGAPVLQDRVAPLSGIRQTIARRLVEAKATIPHYQVTVTFNMDPLLGLRGTLNEQLAAQAVKLSVNDFLVRGCALAIRQHPEFNASWESDHIAIHGNVNIGLAISLPPERGGGLVVGTLRDADRKSLRTISQESRRLAEKARTRGLTIDEMADSTFVLSNLGMYGVDRFTAIINPPNSAILAVGAAIQKPVVRNGELAIGHEMAATASLDHRLIDGAMAAEFLQTLKELIEHPATLLV